jgi:hypothetical protein
MIYLFVLLLSMWCLTGFYLAKRYQGVVQQVYEFREQIKRHVLKNGTTDDELYELVVEHSRTILPSEHPVNQAKSAE